MSPDTNKLNLIEQDVPEIVADYIEYLEGVRQTKARFEMLDKKFACEARDYVCAKHENQYPNLYIVFPEHLAIQVFVAQDTVSTSSILQYITSALCVVELESATERVKALSALRDSMIMMTREGIKFATLVGAVNTLNSRIIEAGIEVPSNVPTFIHNALVCCSNEFKQMQ